MKKFTAFTLAETLVVIGIIGVVSALTLPNLNSSTGDKEKVAQVKKIYQNLNDAYGRAVAKYGVFPSWTLNDSTDTAKATRIGQRLTEFMKVNKTCGTQESQGCFTTGKPKTLTGSEYNLELDKGTDAYKIISADGTSLRITKLGEIYVDIDGPSKGSNVWGKDIFLFKVDLNNPGNGIVPGGSDVGFSTLLSYLASGNAPHYATAWIVNYHNAEYLKLNSSGQCTNNTSLVPTEQNPRCK